MKRIYLFLLVVFVFFSAEKSLAAMPESFSYLAEKLTPAVVNISTTKTIKSSPQNEIIMKGFPKGHPFEDFNEFFERFVNPHKKGSKAMSLGSGFVIDKEGYIVTNNHVIAGADEITVSFADSEEYSAKLIGSDKKTDLALLKIDAGKELPHIEFGDSDESKVGDWIIVIGNPFGLGGTVTAGIISARARDINSGPFDDFIQTDAAINRGNSGGPMFNMDGEVIGINTAIFSPNGGGNVGIGFAVPSSMAEPIINQLKEDGKVQRGWLGVRVQKVTEDIAEGLGVDETEGALVAEVILDSPAEKGGVRPGDLILTFDGKKIKTMKTLPRVVAETKVGKKVDMEIIRSGEPKTLRIEIAELNEEDEDEETLSEEEESEDEKAEDKIMGISVSPLTNELKKKYTISKSMNGLFVHGVKEESPAAEKGIRKGDVISKANQKDLETTDDLKDVVEEAKDQNKKSVLLFVHRRKDTIFIAVPLED